MNRMTGTGPDRRTQARNREEERTMISKTFRITGMMALAGV